MTQKELIETYKEISEGYVPDYSKPSIYLKKTKAHFQAVQDGVANPDNFFDNTVAIFEEVKKPKGKAFFESNSGSRYWYSKEGLTRGSNHWGCHVANCDWALHMKNGKTTYGESCWAAKTFNEEKYGFVKWEDFVLKPELLEIDGQEVLTTFANKIGRDHIKVGKHMYQKEVTITWNKVLFNECDCQKKN